MDPNLRWNTCVEDGNDPSKVVTGVVPATMSPMPKSKRKEKYSQKNQHSCISTNVFIRIFPIPFVDNVGALYRLPWILAIVGG